MTAADNNVVALVGSAPVLAVGGAGNVTLGGAASTASNTFFSGFGTSQIVGGSGNDVIFAGLGAATMTGGGGSNVFVFVDNDSGNTNVITDFKVGADTVSLKFYGDGADAAAFASRTAVGGGTQVMLTDGTKIVFQGVSNLTQASFS